MTWRSSPHLFPLLCPTESYLGTEESRDGAMSALKRCYPNLKALQQRHYQIYLRCKSIGTFKTGFVPIDIGQHMVYKPIVSTSGTRPLVQGVTAEVPGSISPEYPNTPNLQVNSYVICLVDTAKFPYWETRISLDPEQTFYYTIYKKVHFFNCLFLCHYCAWMDYIKGLWYVQVQMGLLKQSNTN